MLNKKNKLKTLTIVIMFLMANIVYAQNKGGTFTLTNIPSQYNGMYAILCGDYYPLWLFGGERISRIPRIETASRISDGQVIFPMWIITPDDIVERYSGSHRGVRVRIYVYNFSTVNDDNMDDFVYELNLGSINFSNGIANRAWDEGPRAPDIVFPRHRQVYRSSRYGTFSYTENEDSIIITAWFQPGGLDFAVIHFPDEINGKPVISLDGLFSFSRDFDGYVVLPKNLSIIGDNIFSLLRLNSITFPETLTHIGRNAFFGNNFTEIIIPDSVIYIGDGAFRSNRYLEQMKLSSNLTAINPFTFSYCNLRIIEIPHSVRTIKPGAFNDTPLREIIIGDNVQIAENSFRRGEYTFMRNTEMCFYFVYNQNNKRGGRYIIVERERPPLLGENFNRIDRIWVFSE